MKKSQLVSNGHTSDWVKKWVSHCGFSYTYMYMGAWKSIALLSDYIVAFAQGNCINES